MAFSASAEPCPERRIDISPIPLWDQEDSYLCYAFSAAVLIDAHRLRNGPVERFSSPLALAADTVRFAESQPRRSSFWAGYIDQSVSVARTEGVCGSGRLTDKLGRAGPRVLLPKLRQISRLAGKDLVLAERELQHLLRTNHLPVPNEAFLQRALRLPQDLFLAGVLSFYCGERLPLELPALREEKRAFRGGRSLLPGRLSAVLAEGLPLAAEICAEVVTDSRFSQPYGGPCSRHYVVVVGQREGAEGCELEVRDSQCGEYKSRAGKSGCVRSHYWIGRDEFLSNTHGLHWLE